MPGIEIVSRTQRIIVLPNTSVSLVKQGPTGPQGEEGPAGPSGNDGANGTNGKTLRNGNGPPFSGLGNTGDWYIDKDNKTIYGPKEDEDWGLPTSVVLGNTIRNGEGPPSDELGFDDDFYLDTTNEDLYGPKTDGVWGSPTNLIGPPGADSTQITVSAVAPSTPALNDIWIDIS